MSGKTDKTEPTESQEDALSFEQIFQEELNAIHCRRSGQHRTDDDTNDTKITKDPWSMNLLGLAFSGGGIRSATFNLGIIQALAQLKLLHHVDYLSTVSGGGYIGSWLSAQFHRELETTKDVSAATEKIEETLSPESKGFSHQVSSSEPKVIRFLRQHSNYLTPKAGLFTADTWSILVTYLRNGLLNLIILTCLIAAMLMLPRLLAAWGSIMTDANIKLFSLVSGGFGLSAAYVLGYNLGWYHQSNPLFQIHNDTEKKTRSITLLFLTLAIFLLNLTGLLYLRDSHQLPVVSLNHQQFGWLLDVLSFTLILTSFLLMHVISTRFGNNEKPLNDASQGAIIVKVVLPIIFVAYTSSFALPLLLESADHTQQSFNSRQLFLWMAGTAVAHLFVWFTAYSGACGSFFYKSRQLFAQQATTTVNSNPDKTQEDAKKTFLYTWKLIIACSFFSGFIMGPLLYVFTELNGSFSKSHLLIKFGPPLYVVWLFLLSVLHTGLIGRGFSTGEREWLNRLGAWLLIFSVAWLLINGLSFFSPLSLDWLSAHQYIQTGMASGWVLTTIAGLIASRKTSGEKTMGGIRKLILIVAPYVFILGMIAIVSSGLNTLITTSLQPFEKNSEISEAVTSYKESKYSFALEAEQLASIEQNSLDYSENNQSNSDGPFSPIVDNYRKLLLTHDHYPLQITLLFVCLIVLIILLSWRIDITEFSLHRLYENRLTRCYLGASNKKRIPQPFSGFSKHDDIPLHALIHQNATREQQAIGPYHLINTAINLVSGEDLAWQERKAASFVLSPLYCGFVPPLNGTKTEKQQPLISNNGYRPTAQFACNKPGLDQTARHCLTLGDAMTTSGAAASPNMGSHSSAIFSMLLAVFNIRLGRWTGNPRHRKTYRKSGPAISIQLLIAEIFGLTKSTTEYVYLSDGGHFENLGIYELVRRRCRFIIAIDAGADPQFKFDDLGNAIRKCRNDFGVSINIDVSKIRERNEEGFNAWPCAIGTIDYSDTQTGTLLYIKSSLLNDAPEDVLNYAAQNPTFPHQTTGDQFFTESQFESYRYLGYHIGMKVLADASFNNQEATSGSV